MYENLKRAIAQLERTRIRHERALEGYDMDGVPPATPYYQFTKGALDGTLMMLDEYYGIMAKLEAFDDMRARIDVRGSTDPFDIGIVAENVLDEYDAKQVIGGEVDEI